jgi:hypothetical protein
VERGMKWGNKRKKRLELGERYGRSNYCKSTFVTSHTTLALVMMHTVS